MSSFQIPLMMQLVDAETVTHAMDIAEAKKPYKENKI